MSLTPNTKLGPYEIIAPLGAGGMGEVYRARDPRLDRDVAVKVLAKHLSSNLEFKGRFEREAKSISQLAHPNICTLHDVGHHDGTDYLVMELLEGESLAQRLLKGPLPIEQAVEVGVDVASALDAAHRKGVIHRDLKPGNVMLTRTGAKLLDFGLAKSSGVMGSDPSAVTVSQPLTSQGTIVGTFQYMAPEQLEGQEADTRTDIFALGAVLYEIATGKRAFEGASRASLIVSIMSSQPRPISEMLPLTPVALDRLIRKCLEKDPDKRWQSAADAADELRWIAQGAGSATGTASPVRVSAKGYRRGFVVGAGMAALAAVIAFTMLYRTPEPPPPLVSHVSVVLPDEEVVDGGLENLMIAVSPDGRSLAYCARKDGKVQLHLRKLDQREPIALNGTEGAYDPFFSPDGEWIGFFAGPKLRKISVRGGVAVPVADSIESRSGSWVKPDEIVFVPAFDKPLMRVSASGGTPQSVTTIQVDRRERTHRWPEVLPGGEWVVFTVGTLDSPGGYDEATIEAASIATGERRVLVKGGRMARFAPPGYLVFARGNVLYAAAMDPADPRIVATPLPVLDGVGGEDSSGAAHFSISRDGTLAYVPGGAETLDELVWVDHEGKIEPVGAPVRTYEQVRVSPDGTQLLLSQGPSRAQGDLWRYDLTRTTLTRVTFDQKSNTPTWTPDQKSVVYRTEAGGFKIMVQPIDGSTPPRELHTDADPVLVSGISPDGRTVYYQKYGMAASDIMVVPIDGSAPGHVLWEEPNAQYAAMPSPDGKWIAYVSQPSQNDEVFIRAADGKGGKWQVSGDSGLVPLWAPDGKELYFVRGDALFAVSIEAGDHQITAGAPRKLFDFPPGRRAERDTRSFDITPDGKRFILMRSANPGMGRRNINIVLNWSEELKSKVPAGK